MIRDDQAIMKTWFPVGQQRIIPTYGKHEGVKLVRCLGYSSGKLTLSFTKNMTLPFFFSS